MAVLIELFGWYGAAGLILGYALNSLGILSATSIWYQLLNLTAALGIVVVSFYKRAYQPGILNAVWACIALIAITRILFT
jgi:hypothetical protein